MHQTIVTEIARDRLRSLGFVQKGRSRFWYRDYGWYALFAEFQPMSGRQGSSLNYGATWFWYPHESWAFDHSDRLRFVAFHTADQFRAAVNGLVEIAIDGLETMRSQTQTLETAHAFEKMASKPDWGFVNLAVLAGLTGRPEVARRLATSVIDESSHIPWMQERNAYLRALLHSLESTTALRIFVEKNIAARRAFLALAGLDGPALPA